MALSDLVNLSVATDLIDEGGTLTAELSAASRVEEEWALDTGWSCVVEVPATDWSVAHLLKRHVLLFENEDGSTREYRIADVEDGRSGGADVVTVRGQDPMLDLAERAIPWYEFLSDGRMVFEGSIADATATEILTNVIVVPAAAEGIAVAIGTVDAAIDAVLLEMRWSRPTRLALLRQLVETVRAKGIPCECDYVRDVGTGYTVDLATAIGSGATVPELHVGRHIGAWKRKASGADQASRVIAFGGVDGSGAPATMEHAAWLISVVNGGANTFRVVDPRGGPGPVQFNDQADPPEGPWYVQSAQTGVLHEILDSTKISATVSEFEIADVTDFAVDDEVEFRFNASGASLLTLVHPTNIQAPPTGFGSKIITLSKGLLRGERNLIPNAWMETWTGASNVAPDGWIANYVTRIADPVYVKYGPYALYGPAGLYSPLGYPYPRSGTTPFTMSFSMWFMDPSPFPAVPEELAFFVWSPQAGELFSVTIPGSAIAGHLNARWDVSITGIVLPLTLGPSFVVDYAQGVRIGFRSARAGGNGHRVILDAVQFHEGSQPADQFFKGARGNALWQAANQYLADFGDPPPAFDGALVDYARIDPTNWAHVAIAPGVSTRVIDDGRGLDLTYRAVKLTWNRLLRGDTRVQWATKASGVTDVAGTGAMGVLGPSSVLPPTEPPIPPIPPVPPGSTTVTGTLIYPIHASLNDEGLLAAFPSALTEGPTRVRAKLYLGGCDCVRLSGRVVTALAGAKYRAVYSLDGTGSPDTDWDPLGTTVTLDDGPYLPLDSTGDIVGEDVVLVAEAKGDVFVAFLQEGGDDASDVEVGNLILQAHPGAPLNVLTDGCGLSGFTIQGDDFAGAVPPAPAYADTADFDAYYGTRLDYYSLSALQSHAIDALIRFNDRPTLRLDITNPLTGNPGWTTFFSDNGDPTETQTSPLDVWLRYRLKIPTTFDTAWSGTPATGDGYRIVDVENTDGVSSDSYFVGLAMRNDHLFLRGQTVTQGPVVITNFETDLGDVSALFGQFADIILRVKISNVSVLGADFEGRAWMCAACTAAPALLGNLTFSIVDTDFNGVGFRSALFSAKPGGTAANAGQSVYIADWEVVPASVDANPFGVASP